MLQYYNQSMLYIISYLLLILFGALKPLSFIMSKQVFSPPFAVAMLCFTLSRKCFRAT